MTQKPFAAAITSPIATGPPNSPTKRFLFEQTLTSQERTLDPDDERIISTRSNLALAYRDAGQLDKALPLHERALADSERVLGRDHPDTLISCSNLAVAYQKAGRINDALPLFERTLTTRKQVLGTDHPETLLARIFLSYAYCVAGRAKDAITLAENVLANSEQLFGADHPLTANARENLAHIQLETGQMGGADPSANDEAFWIVLPPAAPIDVTGTGDLADVHVRATDLTADEIPRPSEVTPPAGTHNLPRIPAAVFTGRTSALERLPNGVEPEASSMATRVICGSRGVGKSELALQHAAARLDEYGLIWWIVAGNARQLQAGLAALAARLCPQVATVGTTASQAGWATAWLQAHSGWLLILDSVSEPADVQALLGQLAGGHILATARHDTGWDEITEPVHLDVLDPRSAAELITTLTGRQDDADKTVAASIAAELGYLPLALDQAAAYIDQADITFPDYLERLRQHPADVYTAAEDMKAQQTISRIWGITIEAIGARLPDAIKLLHILACYAPDSIPRFIVGGGDMTRRHDLDEALGVLASYHMITLARDVVSMHELVQAAVMARQSQCGRGSLLDGESTAITAIQCKYSEVG